MIAAVSTSSQWLDRARSSCGQELRFHRGGCPPDGETFTFSLFGSGAELVPVGGNAYRACFGDVFRQFDFTGDRWEKRNERGGIGLQQHCRQDSLFARLD